MIEKSRLLNPKIASPDTRRRSLRIPVFPKTSKPKTLTETKPQTGFPKQPIPMGFYVLEGVKSL